jgi:hypothetical protein
MLPIHFTLQRNHTGKADLRQAVETGKPPPRSIPDEGRLASK